jgi:hypothetical protein
MTLDGQENISSDLSMLRRALWRERKGTMKGSPSGWSSMGERQFTGFPSVIEEAESYQLIHYMYGVSSQVIKHLMYTVSMHKRVFEDHSPKPSLHQKYHYSIKKE